MATDRIAPVPINPIGVFQALERLQDNGQSGKVGLWTSGGTWLVSTDVEPTSWTLLGFGMLGAKDSGSALMLLADSLTEQAAKFEGVSLTRS